jgi:hypothetical protein
MLFAVRQRIARHNDSVAQAIVHALETNRLQDARVLLEDYHDWNKITARIKEHGDSRLWQKGTGMASRLRRLTGAASGWERRAITLFLNKGAVVDVKIHDFRAGLGPYIFGNERESLTLRKKGEAARAARL